MGIGMYRHVVTLEAPGGDPLTPAVWYCALEPAAVAVVEGQAAYFVTGPYHPAITLETRIKVDGRTLQVQGVADLEERHVTLRLTAVEVRGRV